jgi:hypothetical protein
MATTLLVTLAAASATAQPTATAPVTRDASAEILGWMLSERFPDLSAWPEALAAAFPDRCRAIAPLPCP